MTQRERLSHGGQWDWKTRATAGEEEGKMERESGREDEVGVKENDMLSLVPTNTDTAV